MANTLESDLHPEKIRIATPDEIQRIALVAASGFYYSPANKYERPRRQEFPKDTLLHYQWQMLCCLYDAKRILIVAEDTYEENEDEEVYPALREVCKDERWPVKDGKVVVGIGCMTLKQGSARQGKYQPPGDTPDIPGEDKIPKRDQDQQGIERLNSAIEPSIQKHFGDQFAVDMLAVHPKYWRRGHGTSLLLWAARIADEDGIPLGVAAVPMGIEILERVKFERKDEIEVEAYSEDSGSFVAWIGVRQAQPRMDWGLWGLFGHLGSIFGRRP